MSELNAPRAETVVDLDAVRHNVALLVHRTQASVMTVVKADGYGHGAVPIARAALEAGATWLGACSVPEALHLREAGIEAPILAWLYTAGEDLSAAVAAGIDLSVASLDELKAAEGARVHLKIDTGLNRNGCPPALWPELVRAARDHDVHSVWSHLASADDPSDTSVDVQKARFDAAYQVALDTGLTPKRHLANSAAALTRPDLHFDMVRIGIATYGLNPVPQDEDLRPVMTFRSSVVHAKRTPAGESVSYGQTWTADRETTLALVPVGYADGVPAACPAAWRSSSRATAARWSAGCAWTRSSWTAGTIPCSPATRWSCSARVTAVSRPPANGPTTWAPSTTRSSPTCTAHACAAATWGRGEPSGCRHHRRGNRCCGYRCGDRRRRTVEEA
ncbi:hypothetical protein GCM10029964_114520 [Kibdelosporangium lantanae]